MRRRDLVVIFAAALLARLVYLWQLRGYDLADVLILDPRAYDAEARRILAGGAFPHAFYQAPLYAYFLAGIYALFGHGFLAIRVAQALLGAASVALTADLSARLFGRTAGALTAVLALLYGVFPFYDAQIMKTSLTIFLSVALLWLLEPGRRGPLGAGRSLLAGVALGLGILTRENLLLFLPFGAFLVWAAGRNRRGALLFTAATLLTLLPVTLHNLRASGELILVTSQGGQNFYIGNHAQATGTYANPAFVRPDPQFERADFHAEAERRTGRRLSANEASTFWYLESIKEMLDDPGRSVRLLGKKVLIFLGGIELPDNESLYALRDAVPVLRFLPLSFAVLTPLAILGAIVTWARRREALFLHLFVLVNLATLVGFFVVSRYRVAVAPAFMILAAPALLALAAWARRAEARPLALSGLLVFGAMAPCSLPDLAGFDPRDYRSVNHFANRARMLANAGRNAEAIEAYQSALRINDEIAVLHYELGTLFVREGRLPEARAEMERAVAIRPESPNTRNDLGIVLAELGEAGRAEGQFAEAARLSPEWEAPLGNLARLYETRGDSARRAETLERIAALRRAAAMRERR